MHVTYLSQGKMTPGKFGEWRFDKRSYDNVWPPKNLSLPPPGVPESVVCPLLNSDSILCLSESKDEN